MAPPRRPAAIPTPTPRCALAGVAASEAASVVTATKAANVFFMSLALLEWRLRRHLSLIHLGLEHAVVRMGRRAPGSLQTHQAVGPQKRFFSAVNDKSPRRTGCFPGRLIRFNEGER